MSIVAPKIPKPGFSFDNVLRNAALAEKGYQGPTVLKTGTTICGVVFKDGVVLGADTRATAGSVIADSNCEKIHYVAPNIYCCGAGVAADTVHITKMISSNLALQTLSSGGKLPRVVTAQCILSQRLHRHMGYITAALVLGGYDCLGPHLYTVYPHGSADRLPCVSMGSGSLAAIAVLESRFKADMELDEAMKLVRDAIAAGIMNDLGSGSNVDLCVITKDGATMHRTHEQVVARGERLGEYKIPPGATAVNKTKIKTFEIADQMVRMDTS